MPRRRTTRASTKRPGPTLPDGDENAKLDKELRKEKVEALLKDFNNEIESKIRNLELMKNEAMRQIDLAYTVEIMHIKPEHRSMKLVDYLAMIQKNELGSATDNASGLQSISNASSELTSQMPMISEDGSAAIPATAKKTRKTKTDIDGTVRQTAQRRGRTQKASTNLMTPALQSHPSMFCNATPLVTPKFDPRLFQTLQKRVPKPGEAVMSMDGSPITVGNTATVMTDAFIVPIDKSRSIVVHDDQCDLSGMDSGTAQLVLNRLDGLRQALQAVVGLEPRTRID